MASAITVTQRNIIHKNGKYIGGRAPGMCYEWSKSFVAYETMLVFNVGKLPAGSTRKVGEKWEKEPGLCLRQDLKVDFEVFGAKSGCGTVHFEMIEVFPLNGTDNQEVEDPQSFGFSFGLACENKGMDSIDCHFTAKVTSKTDIVIARFSGAKVGGRVGEQDKKSPSDKAIIMSGSQKATDATGKNVDGIPAKVDGLGTGRYQELDEGNTDRVLVHRYFAEINHCSDWDDLSSGAVKKDKYEEIICGYECDKDWKKLVKEAEKDKEHRTVGPDGGEVPRRPRMPDRIGVIIQGPMTLGDPRRRSASEIWQEELRSSRFLRQTSTGSSGSGVDE